MAGRTRRLAVDPRVIVLVLLGAVICLPHLRQMKRAGNVAASRPSIIWLQKAAGPGGLYEVDNAGGWDGLYERLGVARPSHNTVPWPPADMTAFRLRPAQEPQPVAWPPSLALLAWRPFSINLAAADSLTMIHGVGPGLAAAIIRSRRLRGPFKGRGDLLRVSGIGPKTAAKIAAQVDFGPQ
ncbi:ComEA family DNA-binding protein [Desulfobacterota bacterium M19]